MLEIQPKRQKWKSDFFLVLCMELNEGREIQLDTFEEATSVHHPADWVITCLVPAWIKRFGLAVSARSLRWGKVNVCWFQAMLKKNMPASMFPWLIDWSASQLQLDQKVLPAFHALVVQKLKFGTLSGPKVHVEGAQLAYWGVKHAWQEGTIWMTWKKFTIRPTKNLKNGKNNFGCVLGSRTKATIWGGILY